MIVRVNETFGRSSRNRVDEARFPVTEGARAALETFYFAFNHRELELLRRSFADDALVQLDSPLGGMLRGPDEIETLYARILHGRASVWVELTNVIQYGSRDLVVFAGRERGQYEVEGLAVPLAIRATRVFQYLDGESGWRQVHYHGSIDDPDLLGRYRTAVRGA